MPPRVQLRALAAALLLLGLLVLFHLGERLMKKLPLLVACVAAAALAGCGTISAADQSIIAQAVAAKIPYCSGDIQIDAGLGGIAGTGTGVKDSGQLHCPGKPYETGPGTVAAPTPPQTAPAAPAPAAAAPPQA